MKNYCFVNELVDNISNKNLLQYRYLTSYMPELTDEELHLLNNLIEYFISKGETIDSIADAYLRIIKVYIKEQHEFIKSGRYRYSKYSEVCDLVYNNRGFMHEYMLMQNISQYLFITHLSITRYFKSVLLKYNFQSGKYLEIGPGYGGYFMLAMKYSNMDYYEGIDISETSVKGSIEYINTYLEENKNYKILLQDFYKYYGEEKSKLIVSTEVLEHVEYPLLFLEKIRENLSDDGISFVTTAINAPALDHIYLFRNKEEIFEMVKTAGLYVSDYLCITSNRRSLEHAEKNNEPIVIGLLLGKNVCK